MDKRSQIRSKLIYDVIDNSNGFYYNAIDKNSRSRVVIPFRVGGTSGDDALEKKFLEQAKAEVGLLAALELLCLMEWKLKKQKNFKFQISKTKTKTKNAFVNAFYFFETITS